MQTARRRPDGTFVYGDEIYRLEDVAPDHFAVRRVSDDKVVGELRFSDGQPSIKVTPAVPSHESPALYAVANLLAVGRGLLPLQ
jgi:hypothetical protein